MASVVKGEHGNISDKHRITLVFLAEQRGLLPSLICCMNGLLHALGNPKMSILIWKRCPYTENADSEMPGDSNNVFLHLGDILGLITRSL